MKKVDAETTLEIWVYCPYCTVLHDVTEIFREDLGDDLRASGLEYEITCENGCEKLFIVNDITY